MPEQIVLEQRVGEPSTVRLAWRAGYSRRGQRGDQVRGVLHRYKSRGYWEREKHMACGAVGNKNRIASWWRSIGIGSFERVEKHACRSRGVVGHYGVVDEADLQSILQRDSASIPTRNVIRDDVVLDSNTIPI